MKNHDRIPLRQLLDPALSKTDGRGDQDERRLEGDPGDFERDHRAERAADDDRGQMLLDLPEGDSRHDLEIEPFEGRDIQVRSDEP